MERIHVSVRARPLSQEEAKTSPWRISGNSIFMPNQPSKFEFDRIFGEECKTIEVYTARTRDIVAAAVRGFNGTVFAYGQTSSGKTHTMRGSAYEPGVIPLAVHDLFSIIQEDADREFLLRMSYMEIYNEDINDLLAPENRKLQIHESLERGIFVAGLREEIVASADQVLERMEFGESHRHIGETNMNVYSSRSHTIFRMIIESREKTDDADSGISCDAVRVSVLNLVDLAGSERAAKTGAEGVRLKEGSHINKSLMTLGTVIKKLSEGAESQGGHVPYRDSKLTRILQPALGGNANTAIICNITLAQIHADETKSSLQFASRALRVTNCAHVNEILTDAALLKRQKKEIEELRAKLQGLHSEHLEEEILNLRNTLLKSELERERMALELEEEKKAQAGREKRLQEQAKRIENLSSMVFCSTRDENRGIYKKVKRRHTWCPGKLSRETLRKIESACEEKTSAKKPVRPESDMGPLLPFKELIKEAQTGEAGKQEDSNMSEDYTLPNPHALLHVTSRRKAPTRGRNLPKENNELAEMQADYESLFLKFETEKTMSDIQIDHLTRKLAEVEQHLNEKYEDNARTLCNANQSLKESDAILIIKELREKIAALETEKSFSQKNIESIVGLAAEQRGAARERYEELYEELLQAQKETAEAKEQLVPMQHAREEFDSSIQLVKEAQEIMLEIENSRYLIGSITSVMDELFQCFSATLNLLLDLKYSASHSCMQAKSIMKSHEKLNSWSRGKVKELEDEKLFLQNQSSDLCRQMEELSLNVQNSATAFTELVEKCEMEKSEFLSQICSLQKDISFLSSSSLAKEKESMRKDLEKTKAKLKDTEFKLKNVVQEKTKLEAEKACSDREVKHLHSQKAMLERDINKRDSMLGRRRDSVIDRGSNLFDKRAKGMTSFAEQAMQEEYKKLEVLAFEMETTIASLEEQLAVAHEEKGAASSRAEYLASQLQAICDELHMSNSELSELRAEITDLRSSMEESEFHIKNLESSVNTLVEEKDEMAMQLTEALLTMEEEKAIWSAKEKASIEAIEGKARLYTAEIASLSKEITEVKDELRHCRAECKDIEERLALSEKNAIFEKKCSAEKSIEIDGLRQELKVAGEERQRSEEILNSEMEMLSLKYHDKCNEVERLRLEIGAVSKEREDLLAQIKAFTEGPPQSHGIQVSRLKHELEVQNGKLTGLEAKTHEDKAKYNLEKAKLRMRLKGTQNKLDVFRIRFKESLEELDYMNKKFEAASSKLKDQLATYGTEVLHLKKQLAAMKG